MGRRFEWDERKAASNLEKHGVSFFEATTVFYDPLSVLKPDPDHSLLEHRLLVLGTSCQGRILVISFVMRGSQTRVISARRATRQEKRRHEQGC